jgi:riboflavin kinase/FMN adenylyltransferase
MVAAFLRHDLTSPVPEEVRGAVLAIGNFDGVHLGHRTVLDEAMALGRAQGVPTFALTFEPHPRTLFKPESPVFRLTPQPVKARVLEMAGLDGVLVLPFTRELAATSAQGFVDTYLAEATGASHVVTGFNFMFGAQRQGTPEFLASAGDVANFGVTVVDAHLEDDGEAISSSRIRRLLGAGDVSRASDLLGWRWCVSGKVAPGAKLGRTLGYPTANIALPASAHLAHGVYAVRLRRANGSLHDGVASFGRRPTFDNGAPLLETFVFDFDHDLYGEEIEVALFERLRGEEKFDSADALVRQMDRDSEAARTVLAQAKPLSDLDRALTFTAGR